MCAGIGAPGTLREILRGYFGDKNAPERFGDDDVVKAGFVTIGPGEIADDAFWNVVAFVLDRSSFQSRSFVL
jgi:hypothetical protein